ncbi:MAG: hypothetical protein WCI59_16195 [Betaproteobacteria bacterium]|jgi:hypothetical protein
MQPHDISFRAPQLQRMAYEGVAANLVADEVVQLWGRLEGALRPVVGTRGVAALYGRSLQLAAALHPCLAKAESGSWKLMDLTLLRLQLASQTVDEAVQAGLDHLGQFDQLLGSLIGNTVKDQILAPAWAPEVAGPAGAPVTPQTPQEAPAILADAKPAPRP